ncbi:MAG: PAS domain S-box protein [Candidatus Omnitrophota bacterium]
MAGKIWDNMGVEMAGLLRVLMLEDSELDSKLILAELRKGGFDVKFERVFSREATQSTLKKGTWNIILSDYVISQFNALDALKILKDSGLELPFIVISRAMGEETAVETMRAGANDCLMKENLSRLCPVIERELAEVESRRLRKKAEEELRREKEFTGNLISTAQVIILVLDTEGRIVSLNPYMKQITGYRIEEVKGRDWFETFLSKEDHLRIREIFKQSLGGIPTRGNVNSIIAKDGHKIDVEWYDNTIKADDGTIIGLLAIGLDVTGRKKAQEALRKVEWMLTKSAQSKSLKKQASQQSYGDVTICNTSRLILDSVGEDVLSYIADDFLDLLDTCAAIYEKNGDYAYGIFTSDWCRFMDEASRNLCGIQDNKEAFASGKWVCHESCWNEASKVSIETARPVDIECKGGIHIYAVPIYSGKEIVGSINFGYGDPPKDPRKIKELASLYGVKVEKLFELANSYESRPFYIIEIAKKRLAVSAKLIGDLVERKKMEEEMQKRLRELEVFYKASIGREERILELKKEIAQLKKEKGDQ